VAGLVVAGDSYTRSHFVLYEAVIEQIAPGAFIKEPRDDEFAAVNNR
jgi:hypothetical protein